MGKQCWAPGGTKPLGNIPQLKALYKEADATLSRLERDVGICEQQLNQCLRAEKIPPTELVQAIAVAKVKGVETAISLCFRLKQEVGSYALMGDTGFEQMDFLQCCKFAEGDSRILMQKMARDRMAIFKKGQKGNEQEDVICRELAEALQKGGPDA